jgi:hypothetical protein
MHDPEVEQQLAFVQWLKANHMYNPFESANTMRRMMRVWMRALSQREELVEACEGLLTFIRERYPDDFKQGGRGFTCPHHMAIETAIKKVTGQCTTT